MKQSFLLTRWFFVVVVCIGNIVYWLIPSDIVELVAREQQILCGRYSRGQFGWMLGVALLSAVAIYVRLGKDNRDVRQRVFTVVASTFGIALMILIADGIMRLRTQYPYDMEGVVYRRPAGKHYQQPYVDQPEAKRSYPVRQPGFGTVECSVTYDENGYRNKNVPATCDILAVGDSFTEGSRVSDDQPWPVVLAKLTQKTIYNLGVSGYNAPEYLASLKTYGLQRKPTTVICMLYEGNDFRTGEVVAKAGIGFKQIIRTSPLLLASNDLLIRVFGPINADSRPKVLEELSWMPIEFPHGEHKRYYAFAPKRLIELNMTKDEFAISEEWFAARGAIRQMDEACKAAGARLIIAYAPTSAHVVFPLAAADIPAKKVVNFLALRSKKKQLPPDEIVKELVTNIESHEQVIAEWCANKSLPFIPLTAVMRDEAKAGRQVYYSYDQHWTPLGQEAAAKTIAAYLKTMKP